MIQGFSIRMVMVAVFALALACVLFLQAASGVTAKRSPELALRLMPANGMARDRLAIQKASRSTKDPTDRESVVFGAQQARDAAIRALASEPLMARSLTVVATTLKDIDEQSRFLDLAEALDGRSVSLRGVRLSNQVAQNDYEGVFQTVDRILRVAPQFSDQFFPILLKAVQADNGIANLRMLSKSGAPWLDRFLLFSVEEDLIVEELSEFRKSTLVNNPEFDRRLITKLVDRRAYDLAQSLYHDFSAKGRHGGPRVYKPLSWTFAFPPFDWALADESRLRAQPALGMDGIEIFVSTGSDGVLAERVIQAPAQPFEISVKHQFVLSGQLEYLRLILHCGEITASFSEKPLVRQLTRLRINRAPSDCEYLHVVLYARVFSSQPPLRGVVSNIELAEI